MATIIGKFTIKDNDLGNLPSDYNYFIRNTSKTYAGGGGGSYGNNTPNITTLLDLIIIPITQNYGGTITYTLNGPNLWNSGTDTIVTLVIDGLYDGVEDIIPYYWVLITEDYQYPIVWETTIPGVPTICNTCQLIQLTQCGTDSFLLDLGLADGNYTAYYTDNTSGVVWEQGTYSSTAQGGLSVYQWDATVGMFNPYSFYTMTLKDSNGDDVSWVVNDVEYTCATLTFKTTVNVTD